MKIIEGQLFSKLWLVVIFIDYDDFVPLNETKAGRELVEEHFSKIIFESTIFVYFF